MELTTDEFAVLRKHLNESEDWIVDYVALRGDQTLIGAWYCPQLGMLILARPDRPPSKAIALIGNPDLIQQVMENSKLHT